MKETTTVMFSQYEVMFYILLILPMVGFLGYMIGVIYGQQKESSKVVGYCLRYSMNLTGELIHDLYPLFHLNTEKVRKEGKND